MATVQCEYEVGNKAMWFGETHTCQHEATWAFTEAPYGTADPRREQRHLCTRHYNAWKRGSLDAVYIETDTPRRIEGGV